MLATARTIFELAETVGADPEVSIDTDDYSPPIYTGLTETQRYTLSIGPSVADQDVTIPAACYVLIVADEPILWRWAAAETQIRARRIEAGSEDATHTSVPATTAKISGNGSNAATVRVIILAKV